MNGLRLCRRSLPLAAAATLLILSATAQASGQSSTWEITPSPANFNVDGHNVQAVFVSNGIDWECDYSPLRGTLTSASGSPAEIGSIEAQFRYPCSSILGNMYVDVLNTWRMQAEDFDPAAGVTSGHMANVSIGMSIMGCGMQADGSIPFTYSNTTGDLSLKAAAGDLVMSQTTRGCDGLWGPGDSLLLDATYHVTTEQGSPTIVGPSPS
jgi:hypothetical protein